MTAAPDEDAGPTTIRCTGVRKTYRTGSRVVEALRGVDLEIERPGFYAVMGASGSGKSTLLHLMAGLDAPDAGEIVVAGRHLDGMSERERTAYRRHEIGIVFQQFNLIPTLTALGNVELPGVLAAQPATVTRERSMALLEMLGLADRASHRPEALSGGEQQRVAIARALHFDPRVLFADEPTGNLDSASSERLWSLLASLSEERELTVVMVTHEPAAAIHCRRAYILRDGVMIGTMDTSEHDATTLATEYQRACRPA